ncbi:MAG: twin-arginine translocase TatA/TatE family subunit [Deltaproteobacteria bacterium]|nr:twin-arginine translocase TatA/TatE family subunit [Deltaproteobacteria bacterium]
MFDLGSGEILLVLVLALVFIGPKRLPEIATTLGRWSRKGKKVMDELREGLEKEIK